MGPETRVLIGVIGVALLVRSAQSLRRTRFEREHGYRVRSSVDRIAAAMLQVSAAVIGVGLVAVAAVPRAASPVIWGLISFTALTLPARFRSRRARAELEVDPRMDGVDRAAESFDRRDLDELADALDGIVRNSKPIPLTRRVRVRCEQVYELLDQMRVTLPLYVRDLRAYRAAHPGREASSPANDEGHDWLDPLHLTLAQLDALDEALHRARRVPLIGLYTDEVAVSGARISALVASLRSSIASMAHELSQYRASSPPSSDPREAGGLESRTIV